MICRYRYTDKEDIVITGQFICECRHAPYRLPFILGGNMSIIQLIASSNYITVNKSLVKLLGIEETIILGELASEYEYWSRREELQENYFYSTIENIEENTTLTEYKQRKALNNLKEQGIIDIKIKGIPAKRFIKINEEQVFNLLNIKSFKNSSTSSLKIKELDAKKLKGNKNKSNKNNNKNNNIYIEEFETLWKLYPNKKGKDKAQGYYIKARKEGTTFEQVKQGIEHYNAEIEARKTEARFVKNGSTWFNQHCWNDEYQIECEKSEDSDYMKMLEEMGY